MPSLSPGLSVCKASAPHPPHPKLRIKAECSLGQKLRVLGGPEGMLEAACSAATAIAPAPTPTIPVAWAEALAVSSSTQEGPHLDLLTEGHEHAGGEGRGSTAWHEQGSTAWHRGSPGSAAS